MKITKALPLAALASLSLVLAACSGGGGASTGGGIQVPDLPTATEVGESEGQVNIVAWAGFVEDGSTNPNADWVSQFEKETVFSGDFGDSSV